MLTVIKTELKRRKLYTLFWSIGIIALTAFTVLAYGSIKNQADQLNKALASFSSSTSSFFGTSDFFSPTGYLNSQLFYIVLPILFIILGVTLSGSLTAKEERSRTMELLLSRPLSRSRLLLAKIITADIIVAILGLVAMAVIILCSWIVGLNVPAGDIALVTVWMVLFAGGFGAVAMMFYVASSLTRRAAAAAAILFSLGGYILTSVGGMVHSLNWLAKLFPYHYYNPGEILHGHVSSGLIIYVVGMYAVTLVVALIGFRRRDIA